MAKYSGVDDMPAGELKKLSQESDHVEAAEYVDKLMSEIVTPLSALSGDLKELSVTYAIYKRAFYESKCKDDALYTLYSRQQEALKEQSTAILRKAMRIAERMNQADEAIKLIDDFAPNDKTTLPEKVRYLINII